MSSHLQIYDPRERAVVGAADIGLRAVAPLLRLLRRTAPSDPRRILLMRIERIGDLLMALEAITDVVFAAPDASIDLVVGSWNERLAKAIPGIHRVETLDAAWLARDGQGLGLPRLLSRARAWRSRQYDLAINFEPDIRTQILVARSGAARIAGFSSGGGGPLLDVAVDFDPSARTSDNARRLVAAALAVPARPQPARLDIPAGARERARELLRGCRSPLVGVHASGGREIKQWPPERFADVAVRLAHERGATIVLTGSAADKPLIDVVRARLASVPTVDVSGGVDLLTLSAVLESLDVFVTGDTGPMHLAAAVGTPVVAVFGPSDPARYAPLGDRHRIVRIDLPCSPCNRIRLPPERCVGHTPDCLAGIDAERMFQATVQALNAPVATP
ncbi:MAG: glycosyltransferase family 9 protein [Vicinamibacterales bacterium]